MKKQGRLDLRGTSEEMDAFRAACDAAGMKASAVIRDLCKAAVPYMARYCQDGRWFPPRLEPERPTSAVPAVIEGEHRAPLAQTRHTGRAGPKGVCRDGAHCPATV
jgi:hypothetical protein